jgi:hypothetical protein
MTEADRIRQDAQPAYLLHSYAYRETSLIIETFTRDQGRVALVARGARRPRSALRGVLLAFAPLTISWSGKSELRTLHKAEWQGGLPQLKGDALLCGFYLNELLLKHKGAMVWLDTSLPKTEERVALASLEFRQCVAITKGTWSDPYMMFVKIERMVNGRVWRTNYYPLKVSLTDFSTKGAVPPLFESETAEMVREQRGELKREIAEKVFHPMRVSKMMETYGDDWDEKV